MRWAWNTRADAMDAESVRGRMNALRSGQARVEQVGYWHGPSGCLD
ncbi:MAG: hypothetical protein V3T24_04460 [Longimicrobiales bacterium]